MYERLHRRLTLLFTGIAGAILIVMSISYLYMSEKELKDNSFLTFTGGINTMVSNLEHQDTITQEWLAKTSANQHMILAFYDNETPISYSRLVLSEKELALAGEVKNFAKASLPALSTGSDYTAAHQEFYYRADDKQLYHAALLVLRRNSGTLTGVILSSTESLNKQIMRQRIRFFILNIVGILVLFLFSWYYTKKLLKPILESHQKQTAFIASASHELRTPLAVILSSLSAAKSTTEEEKEHFFHIIEDESKRMSTLVNDMLSLARADNHSWSFTMKPVELDTLLLDTFESFESLAKEKLISLQIFLPDSTLPRCVCDRSRIKQVLGILISNALSYGQTGGYVKLKLRFDGAHFEMSVEDNGIGISEKDKPYIFDRFYRADDARSGKEHFGLGLCIAKEIINAHHGAIYVEDTPGGGATFRMVLKG